MPANDVSLRRTEGAWAVEAEDELVMLDPRTGRYFALDAVGRRVWELLAEPRRMDELVSALAAAHAVDEATVRTDVQPFLDDLLAAGLLESVPPTGAG
jgi:hypothetical protein